MKLLFPYDNIRDVQNNFINDLKFCVENGKHMLVHAPTGIGKTASVLSILVPYALEKGKTVFFLTSRHTQHKIAIDTLKEISKKHDVNFGVVDLIGKKGMCNQFGVEAMMNSSFYNFCNALVENKECEFYNNMWTKIGYSSDARGFFSMNRGIYHVEEFLDLARKTKLCPYELAILKAKRSNVVIADYYHIFNQGIREAFFQKTNKFLEKSLIVVDEAHNLPGRMREMMSSTLSTRTIERALKESQQFPEAFEIVQNVGNKLEKLGEFSGEERLVKKGEFAFDDFTEFLPVLEVVADNVLDTKKISYVGILIEFLKLWQGMNDGFARIIEKSRFNDKRILRLHYKCLDPGLFMEDVIDVSQVFFMSGTLLPLEMYRDLLRVKDAGIFEYKNPFPSENKLSLIVPDTTTKYSKRSEEMFKKISLKCAEVCNNVPGNVLVLFPSYEILNTVNGFLNVDGKTIFVERQGMMKEEREEVLEKFRGYKKTGAVLMAVAAGSFSEGIDLPGDELKAVIVVGLPLSRPDLETKSLIDYYDERFGRGWDYGYIFPAMMKVIQGAGRCIRSEKDRGVLVFLDERYSMSNYFRCFPKDYNIKITKLPGERIRKFFEN